MEVSPIRLAFGHTSPASQTLYRQASTAPRLDPAANVPKLGAACTSCCATGTFCDIGKCVPQQTNGPCSRGDACTLTYFRDKYGLEVDAVIELGLSACAVEIKSGETVPSDAFVALDQLNKLFESQSEPVTANLTALVHAGTARWERKGTTVLPWSAAGEFAWPGLEGN